MVRIDLEDVIVLEEQRRKWNRLNLRDIEWFQNGKKIEVTEELYQEWELIGLMNIDFAKTLLIKDPSMGYGITTIQVSKKGE